MSNMEMGTEFGNRQPSTHLPNKNNMEIGIPNRLMENKVVNETDYLSQPSPSVGVPNVYRIHEEGRYTDVSEHIITKSPKSAINKEEVEAFSQEYTSPTSPNVSEYEESEGSDITIISSDITSEKPSVKEHFPTKEVASFFNSSFPTNLVENIVDTNFENTKPPENSKKKQRVVPYTTAQEFLNSTTPYVFHYHPPSGPTETKYLFIVNFHWAKYKESVFIQKQYFKKFSTYFNSSFDMVMVGPTKNTKYHILGNGLPRGGFYSYYSMPFVYDLICVQRSCNYDGFFFMNDDSYVDPQFLNHYNLSQSWSEVFTEYNPKKYRWAWYNALNLNKITFGQAYEEAIKILSKTSMGKKCMFEKSANKKRGYSDAFYLTASDVKLYNKMIIVMYRQKVFLEMASPTVMWCLTHNTFNNCNHGKMPNRKSCVHMHPVKYRQGNNKKFAMRRLDHLNMDIVPKNQY